MRTKIEKRKKKERKKRKEEGEGGMAGHWRRSQRVTAQPADLIEVASGRKRERKRRKWEVIFWRWR